MTDGDELEWARRQWRAYDTLSKASAELVYAINAHMLGMGAESCWRHLFEWAMYSDEGTGLIFDLIEQR